MRQRPGVINDGAKVCDCMLLSAPAGELVFLFLPNH
jgi:hypothetical protein